jgi:hypothetical protein
VAREGFAKKTGTKKPKLILSRVCVLLTTTPLRLGKILEEKPGDAVDLLETSLLVKKTAYNPPDAFAVAADPKNTGGGCTSRIHPQQTHSLKPFYLSSETVLPIT